MKPHMTIEDAIISRLAIALHETHDDIRATREKIRAKLGPEAEQCALAMAEFAYYLSKRLQNNG